MSEENNHLLSSITVKQQNYIYSILQQLIQMQDEKQPRKRCDPQNAAGHAAVAAEK